LFDGVVGQNDQLLGPDHREHRSFDLASECVAIGPYFEEGGSALVAGRPFFNDHNVFKLVSIPPFVECLGVVLWIELP